MSRDLIGVTLGKYHCVEFIGHGGMAEVYRAVDTELDRSVAIKILHPFLVTEEGFAERFRREARALASLKHPNIVQIYDSGLQDFNNYVVMEYVPGPTLKDRLRELKVHGERMPIAEVRRIVDALTAALDHAHHAGIVHRDLKPTNIILANDGRVVLTDFGLAKIIGSAVHTASMAMIGTPAYMAPEQARAGPADLRSDVYALGVIVYELLTGQLPFQADTPFVMIARHAQEALPRIRAVRRDVPRSVDRVLLKATAKAPAERFHSVEQFDAALNAAFDGRRVPFLATRLRLSRAARNTIAIVAALMLVGGFGFGNGWFTSPAPTPAPTHTPSPTPTATRILSARIIGPAELRAQPDPASILIARLNSGTEVALLDQAGAWWQVRVLENDRVGWVMNANLVFVLPTATPTPSNTPPPGASLTPTPSTTPTPQPTRTPSATRTASVTSAPTSGGDSSGSPSTPGSTATPTLRPTNSITPLPTSTFTRTPVPPPTFTRTPVPSPTSTPKPTHTPTPLPPTPTYTWTPEPSTPTPTNTPRRRLTLTVIPSPTPAVP